MKFLLLTLFIFLSPVKHDFHVSLATIEYSISDRTYQVSLKIFTDDFERAIEESFNTDLAKDGVEEKIEEYVLSKFMILDADEKEIPLTYLGKELEMDVTWVYLESDEIDKQERFFIENTLLNEVFDDQSHIVHYRTGESFQTDLLNESKKRTQF